LFVVLKEIGVNWVEDDYIYRNPAALSDGRGQSL